MKPEVRAALKTFTDLASMIATGRPCHPGKPAIDVGMVEPDLPIRMLEAANVLEAALPGDCEGCEWENKDSVACEGCKRDALTPDHYYPREAAPDGQTAE